MVALYTEEEARGIFLNYIVQFNKTYELDEFGQRFQNFQETLARIEGRGDTFTSTFGLTKFSDMSPAEFKAKYLGYVPRERKGNVVVKESDTALTFGIIDWRLKGAVIPVKNQGGCGSCWVNEYFEDREKSDTISTTNCFL